MVDSRCAVAEMLLDVQINAIPFELNAEITKGCASISNTGKIDLNIEGSGGPYKVDWYVSLPPIFPWPYMIIQMHENVINGSGNDDLVDIRTGQYAVLVIDVNGCSNTSVFVVEKSDLAISEEASYNCNSNKGSIVPQVAGGKSPYSFNWNNGS